MLVGIGGLKREFLKNLRRKALLWGMYVAPEVRGKGLGGKLLICQFQCVVRRVLVEGLADQSVTDSRRPVVTTCLPVPSDVQTNAEESKSRCVPRSSRFALRTLTRTPSVDSELGRRTIRVIVDCVIVESRPRRGSPSAVISS